MLEYTMNKNHRVLKGSEIISVISPFYNEQDNLNELYERIKNAIPAHYNWELVLVDDGSTDNSVEVVKKICRDDNRVRLIILSKNHGHQHALTAGYDYAKGKVVVSMDSDLQHPPEVIPEMIDLWEKGENIVFCRRKKTNELGWFKRISSRIFYLLLKKISRIDLIEGSADFRLLDQKAVCCLKQYRESHRFLRGIVSDLGFKRHILDYEEEKRVAGKSKYNLYKMSKLALSGVISFSSFPLRISICFGIGISLLSIIYAIWIIYYKVVYGISGGISSVLVGIFFMGGIQLISIGILGEYLANVFVEVKKRPLYCVSEVYED